MIVFPNTPFVQPSFVPSNTGIPLRGSPIFTVRVYDHFMEAADMIHIPP